MIDPIQAFLFSPRLLVTNGFSALSRGSEGTLAKLGHSVHVKAPFTWHCLRNKSYATNLMNLKANLQFVVLHVA